MNSIITDTETSYKLETEAFNFTLNLKNKNYSTNDWIDFFIQKINENKHINICGEKKYLTTYTVTLHHLKRAEYKFNFHDGTEIILHGEILK